MKIKTLQISNIWSFKYTDDMAIAPKIVFDENFNILIGQNGAGKSTTLEVINFIFRRVLFVPYHKNQDLYGKRDLIRPDEKKQTLSRINGIKDYKDFRLEKNYDFEDKPQQIRIVVQMDDIDRANIQLIKDSKTKLAPLVSVYSAEQMFGDGIYQDEYQVDIILNVDKTYTVTADNQDIGFSYLTGYNLYKEIIDVYNEENPEDRIANLAESFSLIGSYRNYNSYAASVSLGGGNTAEKQIQNIRTLEYSKSTNTTEGGEPSIFTLVRLRMAGECQRLIVTNKDQQACEKAANELEFIKQINEKIKIINLKVEVRLIDISRWAYTFSFVDIKRNRDLTDINSLSAGQKAILHLIFEAYGRGNIKGGLVIIDEPEIHLHYQFQNEYLRVIKKLNREQGCQYILVTHSESLITSQTINSVIRLSLDVDGHTIVNQPIITISQKWLVKILDNKRSTHAFFGSKVLLVEGETDRYLYRAILAEIEEKIKKGLTQDITVLDISEKEKVKEWRDLFESFGLKVFFLADLDCSFQLFYPIETAYKINTEALANQFIIAHPDVSAKIESEYPGGNFILKLGDLELYLGTHQKGISQIIEFCKNNLSAYLGNGSDAKVKEIKTIMAIVTGESEASF